ncbi:magnesium/cobalt transporter CorA [Shimazuella sp. AN120528]|uniref:magnesium/cobalt transporter CorA n=1 Tax=Shimazuella soli TaxID=1892854 RepID=UPI001F0E3A3C|nr:magnesium/cobalt transporter CorA [Shimazuella soli]MCH5585303.1 magnesium/cobalt transporter CorA [Shimazuella soli]
MIRILAYSKSGEVLEDLKLEDMEQKRNELAWYWIDFNEPTAEEANELYKLGFHELAILDCLHLQQRTKLDDYDDYHFFVINAIDKDNLRPKEIDIFQHRQYVVTFHYNPQDEINIVWKRMLSDSNAQSLGSRYICYKIIDKITDSFFPVAEKLEDRLTQIGMRRERAGRMQKQMDEVFHIRRKLLRLRHAVYPLRDLIFRITQSDHLSGSDEERRYYMDVYDYLSKLSSMIDSSREMASDIRDNHISINSNRMNIIMMTLTLFTTIFMPLTFIVGVYGMNFEYMPELKWHYGYFMILGIMLIIALVMYTWFKRKGWFFKE